MAAEAQKVVSRLERRDSRIAPALQEWLDAANAVQRDQEGVRTKFRSATKHLAELVAGVDRLGAAADALRIATEQVGGSNTAALAHRLTIHHVQREYLTLRNEMVLANIGLVRLALGRLRVPPERRDDLLQEGVLGLMRALECYDPNKGTRFSTYAMYWIRNAIARARARNERAILVPTHMLAKRRIFAKHAEQMAVDTSGDRPLRERIREASGLTDRQLDLIQSIPDAHARDLHEEALVSHVDPAAELVLRQELGVLSRVLPSLPPRERRIIEHRFELNGRAYRTLAQLALELGLSRERVRQIQAEALDALREQMDDNSCRSAA